MWQPCRFIPKTDPAAWSPSARPTRLKISVDFASSWKLHVALGLNFINLSHCICKYTGSGPSPDTELDWPLAVKYQDYVVRIMLFEITRASSVCKEPLSFSGNYRVSQSACKPRVMRNPYRSPPTLEFLKGCATCR